jgi:hypothetical protein
MSSVLFDAAISACAAGRRLSWRKKFRLVRTHLRERREYRQLLAYLASERRAAGDLGITIEQVRGWANSPLFR